MDHGNGNTHPIDELGTALMRAAGVLSALTACQDQSRGSFALGETFLMQAVVALEGFVNDARNAYIELCGTADQVAARQLPATVPAAPPPAPPVINEREDSRIFVPQEMPPPSTSALPDFFELRRRETSQLFGGVAQRATHERPLGPVTDEPALSYDALLRKVTAAEVFATERSIADEDHDGPLLPLLKSLRHDLERLRVA